MKPRPRAPHPTPLPAHPSGGLHFGSYQVPPRLLDAVIGVVLLFIAYCGLSIGRNSARRIRRLGWSLLAAGVASGGYVGWHDHAQHAQLVAAAEQGRSPMPALEVLASGWLVLTAAGAVALFALATLAARRGGRGGLGRGRRRRMGRGPSRRGRRGSQGLPRGGGVPGPLPPSPFPGGDPFGGQFGGIE